MKYPRITIFVLAAAMSTGALAKGDHENEDAIYTLTGLLGDLDSRIRGHAVNALGDIGGDNTIPYLLQARFAFGNTSERRCNTAGNGCCGD